MPRNKKDWIQTTVKLASTVDSKLNQLVNHFDGRFSKTAIIENSIDAYAATILPPERQAEKKKKAASGKLKSKK